MFQTKKYLVPFAPLSCPSKNPQMTGRQCVQGDDCSSNELGLCKFTDSSKIAYVPGHILKTLTLYR